ncbi:MAG: hypothetical protein EBY55_08660, partial [Gammaproteobacteria bacterium]|nr:hypothetical protein [Gammaproteobacteria bacterium]
VRSRAARAGRNPKTGETIQIKASKVPAFKAGKVRAALKKTKGSLKRCIVHPSSVLSCNLIERKPIASHDIHSAPSQRAWISA